MKNRINIVMCAVSLVMFGCVADPELENNDSGDNLTRAQSDGKYYYAFDEKVPLNEVVDRVVVTFDKEQRSSAEEHIVNSAQVSKDKLQIIEDYSGDYSVFTIGGDLDKTALMEDLSKQAGIISVRQVYALEDGYEMGYTNEIIMQFKDGVSQQEVDEMHKKFNVKIIKTSKLYVLLSVPVEFDPLDVANAYQESGLTNYSHPNFITSVSFAQSLPTDPYFNNQFYLRNTGQGVNGRTSTAGVDINVVPAWNITKGSSNIVVAVIDQGVTSNHPDLPNSRQVRLNGSNFGSGNPNDPSPTGNENHGNACAGIIGASHHNEGIAGIAPNCKILPIRMGGGIPDIADAIELAADNADVISCSWELLDANRQSSSNPNLYPVIVDAIRYATTSGRRGSKGSIVVFAAGNTANHVVGGNGFITFPANVNISGVLTVGAVDRNGQQANYSPTSNPSSSQNQIIDVVASSHKAYSWQISSETFDVWTIDIPGTAGYNYVHGTDGGSLPIVGSYLPNSGTNYQSYTGHFGGTSAAAPQVAGIAALLLSAYPNMTQSQVANYITSTAGNYSWNSQTGYGLVNAYKALTAPLAISGPDYITVNSEQTFTVPFSLPTGATFNGWTISTNRYTTTGGTGGTTLKIKFLERQTNYVIFARFTINGSSFEVQKTVHLVPPAPIGMSGAWQLSNESTASQGDNIIFRVPEAVYGTTYEWKVNGEYGWMVGGSELNNSSLPTPSYSGAYNVRYRINGNGGSSEWSQMFSVFFTDQYGYPLVSPLSFSPSLAISYENWGQNEYTVSVENRTYNTIYEWMVNSSVYAGYTYPYLLLTKGSTYRVKCRARIGSSYSAWSNELVMQ